MWWAFKQAVARGIAEDCWRGLLATAVVVFGDRIISAGYNGARLAGATICVTISPCLTCAKLIINAGIKEVVYGGDYAFTEQAERLLKEAGVRCRRYRPKT